MKYVSNDRGALPLLVIIVVVALVTVVGVAAYNVNKSSQKNVQTANASPSPASSSEMAASPAATPTPSPASDQDLIVQAVRAYSSEDSNDTVTGITIVGSNAKGNGARAGVPSGYEFVAHKDNGVWKVFYKGQEKPGRTLGEKYGLPADWYSTSY